MSGFWRQWDNKHLEPPTKQWNLLSIDKKTTLKHCVFGLGNVSETLAFDWNFRCFSRSQKHSVISLVLFTIVES